MNTATFIQLAADINEFAGTHGYTEYVENVIEPNVEQAATFYEVSESSLIDAAYKIAADIESHGFVVLP